MLITAHGLNLIRFVHPIDPNVSGIPSESPCPDDNTDIGMVSFITNTNISVHLLEQGKVLVETIRWKILFRWITEE